jgi:hypothetical protein
MLPFHSIWSQASCVNSPSLLRRKWWLSPPRCEPRVESNRPSEVPATARSDAAIAPSEITGEYNGEYNGTKQTIVSTAPLRCIPPRAQYSRMLSLDFLDFQQSAAHLESFGFLDPNVFRLKESVPNDTQRPLSSASKKD